MVKEPRPGRVKTRLGRDVGMTASAWWFRHQCRRLIRRLQDPRWELILAVSPDQAGMTSRVWPGHLRRLPQGHGDLGVRMSRMFEVAPPGPKVIIGADIPGVTPALIADAFRALGQADAVFGPAPDGGYWLIGSTGGRGLPSGALQNVRWSTEHALADSRASMKGMRIAHIAQLRDVDTIADLKKATP